MKHKTQSTSILPFDSGDIFFTFNPSLFGQIKKVITRKSFIGSYLYLDLNGHGIVLGNFNGRLHQISLLEFNKQHKHLTVVKVSIGQRIMKKVLPSLGSRTNFPGFVSDHLGIQKCKTPDQLYKTLKNGI